MKRFYGRRVYVQSAGVKSDMEVDGFSVAVANAHPWVRERAHWRTRLGGGKGAVREVCDLILCAQGRADAELAHHLGSA